MVLRKMTIRSVAIRLFLVPLLVFGSVTSVGINTVMAKEKAKGIDVAEKAEEVEEAEEMESCTCADGKTGKRPPTVILGQGAGSNVGCECGNGESVGSILAFVIDILTIGVGILAVVGISIVGIQYLTASGDEGKVKKSRQRMLEIVIGIALYAAMYVALKWLLPGSTP